jgi:hypothetical protein
LNNLRDWFSDDDDPQYDAFVRIKKNAENNSNTLGSLVVLNDAVSMVEESSSASSRITTTTVSGLASAYGTYHAYNNLAKGSSNSLDYTDAAVGTVGAIFVVIEWFGYDIPCVGECIICYDGFSLTIDLITTQSLTKTRSEPKYNFTPMYKGIEEYNNRNR